MITRITFSKKGVHAYGSHVLPIHVQLRRERTAPMGTFWLEKNSRGVVTRSSLTANTFAARALLDAMLGTRLYVHREASRGDFAVSDPTKYFKSLMDMKELKVWAYDTPNWDTWIWALITDYVMACVLSTNYKRSDCTAEELYVTEFYNRVKW
jgi:hypothetical protein